MGEAAPAKTFSPGNFTTSGVRSSFLSPRMYSPQVVNQPNPMHPIPRWCCEPFDLIEAPDLLFCQVKSICDNADFNQIFRQLRPQRIVVTVDLIGAAISQMWPFLRLLLLHFGCQIQNHCGVLGRQLSRF